MQATTVLIYLVGCIISVHGALKMKGASPLHLGSKQTKRATWNYDAAQGKASFYTEWRINPGSCGYIPQSEYIVALAPSFMPRSCGMCVLVHYQGKRIRALVTDTCPSCGEKKIDISHVMFSQLDTLDKGILDVEWNFVAC